MAEKDEKIKDEGGEEETVAVPLKTLAKMQEQMAEFERQREEDAGKIAGLEEAFSKGADTTGEEKLRTKKTFEPKFRTVRIRKYPIAGDVENMGYVVGWTSRGAYQVVDRTGVSPQTVDMIDIVFLGKERNGEGKLQAEQVKLLDLMNKGIQIHCKIVRSEKKERPVPTGEEIDVSVYDPQHGLITTGEKVDGYVTFSDVTFTIQIPGVEGETVIDGTFVN